MTLFFVYQWLLKYLFSLCQWENSLLLAHCPLNILLQSGCYFDAGSHSWGDSNIFDEFSFDSRWSVVLDCFDEAFYVFLYLIVVKWCLANYPMDIACFVEFEFYSSFFDFLNRCYEIWGDGTGFGWWHQSFGSE